MRVCPQCELRTELLQCPNDGRPTVEASVFQIDAIADPMVGVTIAGKYTITERLGRGGYGAVYRAKHTATGGPAAIKVIRSDLVTDSSIVRRFYLEAQNTHKLSHSNTVRVSDFGRTDDGTLYLIMEFVEGRTLAEALKIGPLPAKRAVHITRQILKSLGEAHQHKLVHRDIKPANIMLVDQVGDPDFVKVLDFGISRSLDTTNSTSMGVVGTPRYMAPEQWMDLDLDGRADLYAVGCILYEMLAGYPPFTVSSARGEAAAMVVMNLHLKEAAPDLTKRAKGNVNEALLAVVTSLLHKDRNDRPASAVDVLATLNALDPVALGALAPAPEPSTRREPIPPVEPTATQPPRSGQVLATVEAQRRPWALIVVVLVLLGVGVAFAAGAFDDDAAPAPVSKASTKPRARPEAPQTTAPPEANEAATKTPGDKPSTAAAPDAMPAPPPPPKPEAPPQLVVESQPPKATVKDRNGAVLGQTPLNIPVSDAMRGGDPVTVELAGYYPGRAVLALAASRPRAVVLRPHVRLEVADLKPGVSITAKSPDGKTWRWSSKKGADVLPEWAARALAGGGSVKLSARRSHRGTRYRGKSKTADGKDLEDNVLTWRHGGWAVSW